MPLCYTIEEIAFGSNRNDFLSWCCHFVFRISCRKTLPQAEGAGRIPRPRRLREKRCSDPHSRCSAGGPCHHCEHAPHRGAREISSCARGYDAPRGHRRADLPPHGRAHAPAGRADPGVNARDRRHADARPGVSSLPHGCDEPGGFCQAARRQCRRNDAGRGRGIPGRGRDRLLYRR